ncbi:MAG: T9SS type A sorting domain-containing protein, partial [Bacteroidetes bacterium]|nr:T9SS type A sorting domain-containing protein [Bacteroidota bacterium]
QIVLVTSPYNQENRTFIGPTQNGWRPLWDIELSDGTSLSNTIVPVRAEFLVSSQPVATDTPSELPEQVALQQNFPNPFNPTTTIRYSLPQSGAVTLAVYDLLGRQVTTLVDGVQTAGAHTVTLDASEWASGLYFYTLQANGQRQTRRMVLVK